MYKWPSCLNMLKTRPHLLIRLVALSEENRGKSSWSSTTTNKLIWVSYKPALWMLPSLAPTSQLLGHGKWELPVRQMEEPPLQLSYSYLCQQHINGRRNMLAMCFKFHLLLWDNEHLFILTITRNHDYWRNKRMHALCCHAMYVTFNPIISNTKDYVVTVCKAHNTI